VEGTKNVLLRTNSFSCKPEKDLLTKKGNDLVLNGSFDGKDTTHFCKLLLFHLLCIMRMKEKK